MFGLPGIPDGNSRSLDLGSVSPAKTAGRRESGKAKERKKKGITKDSSGILHRIVFTV